MLQYFVNKFQINNLLRPIKAEGSVRYIHHFQWKFGGRDFHSTSFNLPGDWFDKSSVRTVRFYFQITVSGKCGITAITAPTDLKIIFMEET